MKKLWRVYVEREDNAELYIEAESPEDARSVAKDKFKASDWWPNDAGNTNITFSDPAQVVSLESSPWMAQFPLTGTDGDATVAQWIEERDKRARTPGTPEYREAVESAGQMTLSNDA